MSHCNQCETRFKFTDVLKATNPASVKCGGCDERIKSSYLTLVAVLVLFALVIIPLWTMKLDLGGNEGIIKLMGLGVVGLVFEFGYFYLLAKGTIKSNLTPPK